MVVRVEFICFVIYCAVGCIGWWLVVRCLVLVGGMMWVGIGLDIICCVRLGIGRVMCDVSSSTLL